VCQAPKYKKHSPYILITHIMKVLELFESLKALWELKQMKMDIKKAYSLRKFIIEVEEKTKVFSELYNELIKKYWEEKDWLIQVNEENINKFFKERDKINEEIDIEIPLITIDDLEWKMDLLTLNTINYLIK